jgi:hypothetical protein
VNRSPAEALAERHLTKIIDELQRGIFSEAKLDLAFHNPDEFLDEVLTRNIEDDERREVIGIIKHTILTGFFRSTARRGELDRRN